MDGEQKTMPSSVPPLPPEEETPPSTDRGGHEAAALVEQTAAAFAEKMREVVREVVKQEVGAALTPKNVREVVREEIEAALGNHQEWEEKYHQANEELLVKQVANLRDRVIALETWRNELERAPTEPPNA